MTKIYLLDCTLRDGGYINDWSFGADAIRGTVEKIEQTGVEFIELGFLKGSEYDPDRSLFPDTDSFKNVLQHKKPGISYVGMADMSAPVSLDAIRANDGGTIDGIRVIFKKNRLDEGFEFVKAVQERGYMAFANFVSTDAYTDREFIDALERFNAIKPTGVTIVDTFGMIKRKHLRRLLAIADNNLDEGIMLCYHAHNNLQQALSNAETMVEMNLGRDIVIDASVFGMGRGAGNLNLELFAEYLNENEGASYKIEPMLEVMDRYLAPFYRSKFWGYSLPLYLTASHGYHPNYGIYLAEKNTLPVKAFDELLLSIPEENKYVFSKDVAETCYRRYLEAYVDDAEAVAALRGELAGRDVLLVAPGKSIATMRDAVKAEAAREGTAVVAVNFYDAELGADYVFMSNMKRSQALGERGGAKLVATSNIAGEVQADYVVNFSSLTGGEREIFDSAGLMALRLLVRLGVGRVRIAGMDGYTDEYGANFFDAGFEPSHLSVAAKRNEKVSRSLAALGREIAMEFVTPTLYGAGRSAEASRG